ncbi:hypothetical protein [Lysobacter niastensis]|uniref:Uncharacterized protein n=1 Tax=Lysobacter niastensis TaxID=380629 RepID=A0ABS0B2Z6_9GAMM|nr:hypothetical protein [Lysobacter niastensis]MBF6022854.1 hypothetical protein [Lysobacter niastensis]
METSIVRAGLEQASIGALQDFIDERLAKAAAIAQQCYGEAGESFRNMQPSAQDEYLWALAGLLHEASEARGEQVRRRVAERETRRAMERLGRVAEPLLLEGDEAEFIRLMRQLAPDRREEVIAEMKTAVAA